VSALTTNFDTGPDAPDPRELRELDPAAAEAELRLGLPEDEETQHALDEAQMVTKETLDFQFSV
jgi:hypothetical protein